MFKMDDIFVALKVKTSEANKTKNAKYMEDTTETIKEWLKNNEFDNIHDNFDAMITNNEKLKRAVNTYWEEVHFNPYPWQILIASLFAILVIYNNKNM